MPAGQPLAVVTQTTLSVDDAAQILAAVKRRFPDVRQPKQQDICYATQNRQDAVKVLAPGVDVLVVVGSPSSSNSNRLRELAERLGADAYMVDTADDLRAEWFEGKRRVGLTAGASAPEVLVQAVVERLRALGAVSVRSVAGRRSASTSRCRWAWGTRRCATCRTRRTARCACRRLLAEGSASARIARDRSAPAVASPLAACARSQPSQPQRAAGSSASAGSLRQPAAAAVERRRAMARRSAAGIRRPGGIDGAAEDEERD